MNDSNGGDDGARTRDLRRDRSALCSRFAPATGIPQQFPSTPIEFSISSKLGLGVRRSMPLF